MCLLVLLMNSYEPGFVKSHPEFNDGKSSICVLEFPPDRPVWTAVHQIVTMSNAVIPLLINVVCMLIITYVVVTKKMRVNRSGVSSSDIASNIGGSERNNHLSIISKGKFLASAFHGEQRSSSCSKIDHLHLLREVIRENKELVIGPAFTLVPQLFSLPLFFASLLLACHTIETSPIRYLFIASSSAVFIPQFLTFFLYITPSTLYSTEWQATGLKQWFTEPRKYFRAKQPGERT